MLRSAQSFLTKAAKLSKLSTLSVAPRTAPLLSRASQSRILVSSRASSTNASHLSDYDQIMGTSVATCSSAAGAANAAALSTAAQLPGATQNNANKTNCYRCVEEPTESEDYDGHELHHPPSEKTNEISYFDDSYESCGLVGW